MRNRTGIPAHRFYRNLVDRFLLLFSLILITVSEGKINITAPPNDKFLVIRAAPETPEQLAMIRELHDNMHLHEIDFWLTPTKLRHKADMMIPERRMEWLLQVLNAYNISNFVTIDDVQQLILEREHNPLKKNRLLPFDFGFSRRLKDEGGNRARYKFGDYSSYGEIIEWMENIERFYPDKARVISIGTTHEGRPIKGIKIGNHIRRTDKRIVWIDAGIHAREWAAVHTGLYFIDRLIGDYGTDPLVTKAVDLLNFYIIPVLNPDGYEYTRSDVSPQVRLWRKNRAGITCKKDHWFRDKCCGGVDLNRNFDWFWGEIGSSNDKCSEIYQGSSVFSEAEARAVRDMIFSPELRGKVDAFITMHTYSQMWIHPFSHQRKTVPEDIADIERVGKRAVQALENTFGTPYRFGTGADILYPSSGGSDDWSKGKGGAKYSYLIELRPGEEVWDGFVLDSRQLIPTGKETWNGIKVVIQAVMDRIPRSVRPPPSTRIRPSPSRPRAPTAVVARRPLKQPVPPKRITAPTRPPPAVRPTQPALVVKKPAPVLKKPKTTTKPGSAAAGSFARVSMLTRLRQKQKTRIDTMKQIVQNARTKSTGAPPIHRVSSGMMAISRAGQDQKSCADRSPWCNAWLNANAQVCTISSIYMRRDCARTCNFCAGAARSKRQKRLLRRSKKKAAVSKVVAKTVRRAKSS